MTFFMTSHISLLMQIWLGFEVYTIDTWDDGTTLHFTNWQDDYYPDYNIDKDSQDCVQMDGSGKWNNIDCSQKKTFVCKYRA